MAPSLTSLGRTLLAHKDAEIDALRKENKALKAQIRSLGGQPGESRSAAHEKIPDELRSIRPLQEDELVAGHLVAALERQAHLASAACRPTGLLTRAGGGKVPSLLPTVRTQARSLM